MIGNGEMVAAKCGSVYFTMYKTYTVVIRTDFSLNAHTSPCKTKQEGSSGCYQVSKNI